MKGAYEAKHKVTIGEKAVKGAKAERLRGRLGQAPMLLRRVVEGMGALVERRHLEEAEAFLAAHPIDEARQAIAQTLERLRQEVELRERTSGAIGRWLAR